MSKRKTTDEFIAEAIGKHGNIFSYEKTKYINNVTKIIVGCKIHGDFLISPTSHVNQGSKCPSCYGNKKKNIKDFIHDARIVHGDKYNYEKATYKNNSTKLVIICNTCKNEFLQVPAVHLQGQGCSSCFGNKKVTIDEFYKHVKDLHNNFYSYENDFSNMRNKITVICPNHGKFKQKAQSHYNGSRCQKCAKAGFDKNKNSYFYIQEIYNDNHLICYKYGITNNTPETRLKKQSYKTKYKQIIMFSIKGSGDYIYNLEKIIKNKFKYHKLLKEEFGDGYTETLELSSINLLEDIILEYILNN